MSKPDCLTILLCESVVEDARSHNKCILNTYNTISAPQFPTMQDRFTVFVSLTDGRGQQPVEVRFVRDNDEPVFSIRGVVKFQNPLDVIDLVLDLRQVPLPGAGPYAIQLRINDELIRERRVEVREIKPSLPGGNK